ncbi:RNA polymerase sigma factor [uncultured Sphingomonas sp.]|uniref:RNA polymerase sigma factor n=1 Tax=uncultured Sphingomonas sp. TaxID=158754 RepID=UPI0025EF8A29|nr:RNA polymerase sigma factor [uncultured Sphingomonas sp.]
MNADGAPADAVLATRAAQGDPAAFAALMRRHRAPIYRLVRGHSGDTDEALDLVQEAFLAAYRAIGRFDPEQSFAAWMSRIAINKCRDWRRRRAVRRLFTLAQPIAEAIDVPDDRVPVDEAVAWRQEAELVARAIAALPANLKEPLLLHTIEGLSQRDTAAILGISAKAVETRLYRARARLRAMLPE